MKYNYHTHTFRCHHAKDEDEEYVLAAIEAGYEEIGFSDHCAWPYKDFVSGMRMTEAEIDGYAKSVHALKKKYKDQISIKLGWECEYFAEYEDWLREILRKYEFDYAILGHHYSPNERYGAYNGFITRKSEVENYKNDVLKGMNSGIFSYIAHPDLFMKGYQKFDKYAENASREIIAKAIEKDIPLEYNLLGLSRNKSDGFDGYPYGKFWEMAGQMGAKAVIGIDAHYPQAYFWEEMRNEALASLKAYGVEYTDKIKFM